MRTLTLSIPLILTWADEYHNQTGQWPRAKGCGRIAGTGDETWLNIDALLRNGGRGLPGGLSLAKLLAEHRSVRNRKGLPPLTHRQILFWAELNQQRTGSWPKNHSGPIEDAPGETWMAVDMALRNKQRGLPGGSSLAQLLAERRQVRNVRDLPPLDVQAILNWADAHRQRSGRWPTLESGPIPEAPGETWYCIHRALYHSRRGLPGGFTLAQLLAAERGVPNRLRLPKLNVKQILLWADAHHRLTGSWPGKNSGPILCSGGETWSKVDAALCQGKRGLPAGRSLVQLLVECPGFRHHFIRPKLTVDVILAWADAFHQRTGRWPYCREGAIAEALEETWQKVDNALRVGMRGLPGGSSLTRLLAEHRGVRNFMQLPKLDRKQICRWAKAYQQRTGRRPIADSGPIHEAPGETWLGVDWALRTGSRGLPGGSSLYQFLEGQSGRGSITE